MEGKVFESREFVEGNRPIRGSLNFNGNTPEATEGVQNIQRLKNRLITNIIDISTKFKKVWEEREGCRVGERESFNPREFEALFETIEDLLFFFRKKIRTIVFMRP